MSGSGGPLDGYYSQLGQLRSVTDGWRTMPGPVRPLSETQNELTQGAPTWADAWEHNKAAYQDWAEKQRVAGVAAGEIDPETGWPTPAGARSAATSTAMGLVMGSTAPEFRGNPLRSYNATADNPAFTSWFGKSHAVDDAGAPLVVYHGTNRQFGEFKPQQAMRSDQGAPYETTSQAHFFTADRDTAREFAYNKSQVDAQLRGLPPGRRNVGDYHLSVQEPLDFVSVGRMGHPVVNDDAADIVHDIVGYRPETWQDVQSALDDPHVIAGLKERGYDGARLTEDNGVESWAVFDPRQVKSATKNRGTFDPNDPRFKYGIGALIGGGAAAGAAQGGE